MILPSKHISQDKALLTTGAVLLKCLENPKTVSAIWEDVRQSQLEYQSNITYLSYDWFVLALDLLYTIDAIKFNEGIISKKTKS